MINIRMGAITIESSRDLVNAMIADLRLKPDAADVVRMVVNRVVYDECELTRARCTKEFLDILDAKVKEVKERHRIE